VLEAGGGKHRDSQQQARPWLGRVIAGPFHSPDNLSRRHRQQPYPQQVPVRLNDLDELSRAGAQRTGQVPGILPEDRHL